MARQYQLPGVGFINAEEDGREYQIPGGGYFSDETVAAPAGLAANPVYGGGAAANPLWGYIA